VENEAPAEDENERKNRSLGSACSTFDRGTLMPICAFGRSFDREKSSSGHP